MSKLSTVLYCLKQNIFLLSTTICIVIGVAVGIIMRVFHAPDIAILYVGLPGELFMRALNFSVIPLLACNIVAVTAKLKPSEQGMIALLSILYCIVMNLLGSFIGLVLTVLINPGGRFGILSLYGANRLTSTGKLSMVDIFPDFLRNLIPDNILKTLLYSPPKWDIHQMSRHLNVPQLPGTNHAYLLICFPRVTRILLSLSLFPLGQVL
ncbi:hypothetical protein AHF37_11575 [Paragonimus kellicotti]|nr:hypothetical protein AHF37_11575 [Paragonimus kellicotti]